MARIIFVHGMFQNPVSWEGWKHFLESRGHEVTAPAWPLHEGQPGALRANPPEGLGELRLDDVVAHIESAIGGGEKPVVIGHSVGGLIVQILLNRGLIAAGVAISSVAPNAMVDLDWSFIKNSAIIANPLMGNKPVEMDLETFHGAFANTLSPEAAAQAFERTATHDSRNVLRDCMGPSGRVDLEKPHAPLLLIAGEEDKIIPADLNRKNHEAYGEATGITDLKTFPERSHFICNEPGWEEVAAYAADWLEGLVQRSDTGSLTAA